VAVHQALPGEKQAMEMTERATPAFCNAAAKISGAGFEACASLLLASSYTRSSIPTVFFKNTTPCTRTAHQQLRLRRIG
jgi:hypothetical protein